MCRFFVFFCENCGHQCVQTRNNYNYKASKIILFNSVIMLALCLFLHNKRVHCLDYFPLFWYNLHSSHVDIVFILYI